MRRRNIKSVLVAMAIAILPLTMAIGTYAHAHARESEKQELLNFIHYCQRNEGLRQVNPNKDYTQSGYGELKTISRFYIEQDVFQDVTDYDSIDHIANILGYE